jgi:hypothetical protein
MDLIYASLVAHPEDEDAISFMAEHGYEVSKAKMAVFRRGCTELVTSPYFEPYQRRRAELAPLLESRITGDLGEVQQKGTTAVLFCIDLAQRRLEMGESKDPTREARDLMQVVAQATDKKLAMEGRPTSVSVSRTPEEIIRSLEAKGLVSRTDVESTAIEERA